MKHHGLIVAVVSVDWGRKGLAKRVFTLPLDPMVTGAVGGREKTGEGCGKESSFEEKQVPIEEAGKRLPRDQVKNIYGFCQ